MTTRIIPLNDRSTAYELLAGGCGCAIGVVTIVALAILTAGILSTGWGLLLVAGAVTTGFILYKSGGFCMDRALTHQS